MVPGGEVPVGDDDDAAAGGGLRAGLSGLGGETKTNLLVLFIRILYKN